VQDASFLSRSVFVLIINSVPLIAAGATTFGLIQKQKIKTEKTFSPLGQLPARFSVGRLPAFYFSLFYCHCCAGLRKACEAKQTRRVHLHPKSLLRRSSSQ